MNYKNIPKTFLKSATIATLAATAGYLIAPIEVRYIQSLTENSTLIGLSYAFGTIIFGLLSVWMGRVSDRKGRRNLIIAGCGLGIIYPLLYASTFNIFQYMGVKVLWAASSVAVGPIFMAHIQDSLGNFKQKGQLIGLMFSVQSILGAAAQFSGGFLSDRFGLNVPYLLMALVFIIAFIYAVFALEESRNIPDEDLDISSEKHFLSGIHYIFNRPVLVYYFIHNLAFSVNWGIKPILWPLIIFSMAGNNTATGSIFASMGVAAFISLLFIGKVVDKYGSQKSTGLSMLILGFCGIMIVVSPNLVFLWIAASLYALGESLWGPSQMVILTDNVNQNRRGEILALDALFDKIYNTLSPILGGFLLGLVAPRFILLIYVSLFLLAYVFGQLVLYKNKDVLQPSVSQA